MTEALQVGQFCCLSSQDLHTECTLLTGLEQAAKTWHKVLSLTAIVVRLPPRARESLVHAR